MNRAPRTSRLAMIRAFLGLSVLCASTGAASAQYLLHELPKERQGVDVIEHRGDSIPLDLTFTNARGQNVELASFFDAKRPVVLILGYYDCPLLCDIVFHKAVQGFNDLAWTLGKEYRVLTVSIDPTNTHAMAAQRQETLHSRYKLPVQHEGWEFLVGDQQSITALSESIGFAYKYIPDADEYSHPAAITILSPDGEISNYLVGLDYPEKQLRLALTQASDGSVGSFFDRVLLYCHVYDPKAGAFIWDPMNIMRIGATTVAVLLGTLVGSYFWKERRARRRVARTPDQPTMQPGANVA